MVAFGAMAPPPALLPFRSSETPPHDGLPVVLVVPIAPVAPAPPFPPGADAPSLCPCSPPSLCLSPPSSPPEECPLAFLPSCFPSPLTLTSRCPAVPLSRCPAVPLSRCLVGKRIGLKILRSPRARQPPRKSRLLFYLLGSPDCFFLAGFSRVLVPIKKFFSAKIPLGNPPESRICPRVVKTSLALVNKKDSLS